MTDKYVELVTRADQAQAASRLKEAKLLASQALEYRPEGVSARELLGILDIREGQFSSGIRWLEEAVALDPTSFQSALWLTQAYRAIHENGKALNAAKQTVERGPLEFTGYNQLGLSYMELELYEEAEAAFRKAVQLNPHGSILYGNMGHALYWLGRRNEAEEACDLAIKFDPLGIRLLLRFAELFLGYLEYELARKYALGALAIDPLLLSARLVLVKALTGIGNLEEAESQILEGLQLDGGNYYLVNEYSSLLEAVGRNEQAHSLLQKSLQLQPRQGLAYFSLISTKKVGSKDEELVGQIEGVLADPRTDQGHHAYLHYSLGKAFEDLEHFQAAMDEYNLANRCAAGQVPKFSWSHSKSIKLAERTFELFDEDFYARAHPFNCADQLPIFVIGMMRSGTTLIEQILSSHPKVGAAGEQPFWLRRGAHPFRPKDLQTCIPEYLKLLRRLCPNAERIVDKMPNNYHHLGLIYAALPKARIIWVRRHPVDTCLSLWSTPRACPPEWGYEKSTIVAEYRLYLEYMSHWRESIPSKSILEVDYEHLISDQEGVTRSMIQFCGLEWNEACLRPQDNVRSVRTPSLWQVRQPVYTTSVERWRKFKPWLGEFANLL